MSGSRPRTRPTRDPNPSPNPNPNPNPNPTPTPTPTPKPNPNQEGVTGIFQFGVDNCLCHVAEPTFLGFCQAQGADCAVKTVAKLHAHES